MLLESFDRPYSYSIKFDGDVPPSWTASWVGGRGQRGELSVNSIAHGAYQAFFDVDGAVGITGLGDAPRTMATVIAAIREILDHPKAGVIKNVSFEALERSRHKLYTRIAQQIGQRIGWRVKVFGARVMLGRPRDKNGVVEDQNPIVFPKTQPLTPNLPPIRRLPRHASQLNAFEKAFCRSLVPDVAKFRIVEELDAHFAEITQVFVARFDLWQQEQVEQLAFIGKLIHVAKQAALQIWEKIVGKGARGTVGESGAEKIKGTKSIAQRIVNAEERFIEFAAETAGLSRAEAERALVAYRKARAIKIDPVGGGFTFAHGGFAEPDVLRRAAGLSAASGKLATEAYMPIIPQDRSEAVFVFGELLTAVPTRGAILLRNKKGLFVYKFVRGVFFDATNKRLLIDEDDYTKALDAFRRVELITPAAHKRYRQNTFYDY